MINAKETLSDKAVSYKGAIIAIAVVFAYSLSIMFYVVFYSSKIVYGSMPTAERSTIILISGFSVAYSVAVFSLIMTIPSSLAGIFMAIALKKLLLYFNPLHTFRKALLISLTISLSAIMLIYIPLHIKGYMTFNYIETISFWFLVPSALFLIVYVIGGIRLNEFLLISNPKIKQNTVKQFP